MWSVSWLASFGRNGRGGNSRRRRRCRRATSRRKLKFESLEGRELLNAAPTITFELLDDTDRPDDQVTSHVLLGGMVSTEQPTFGVRVDFDIDGDGVPDAFQYAATDGRFGIDLTHELAYGEHTVRARAVAVNQKPAKSSVGAWSETTFRYEAPSAAPVRFVDLQIDNRGVLTGTLSQDGPLACMMIELDIGNDGIVDAYTFSNESGVFRQDLSNQLTSGKHAVLARIVAPVGIGSTQLAGSSRLSVLDVQLDTELPDATVEVGTTTTMSLEVDSGTQDALSSAIVQEAVTSVVPQITMLQVDVDGQLSGHIQLQQPGNNNGLYIEIDYNLDGYPDAYTCPDYLGDFSYDMASALGDGQHTIQVRVVDYSLGFSQPQSGAWEQIGFEYEAPPVIVQFGARVGLGDLWTFDGFVDYDLPWALNIQFGGLLQGHSVHAQLDGTFEYSEVLQNVSGTVTAQAFDGTRASNLMWTWVV